MDTTTLALFKKLEADIRDVDIRQGGPRGPKGRKGDKGSVGPSGPKGATGVSGKDGTQGPEGPTGPQGLQGRPGTDGTQGPMGPAGSSGSDGNHGRDGNDGVSVVDANIDFDGHLTLFLSNGTVLDAGYIGTNSDGDIIYAAGGGVPDYIKKAIEDLLELAHEQLHLLYGPDHTDVDSTLPMEDMKGLFWDGAAFTQDRRTYCHFSPTQPLDAESLEGNLWLVTT